MTESQGYKGSPGQLKAGGKEENREMHSLLTLIRSAAMTRHDELSRRSQLAVTLLL